MMNNKVYLLLILFILFFLYHYENACAQDSIIAEKVLVVERIEQKRYQLPSQPEDFKEGSRVTIEKYNETEKIRGVIGTITDSSIIVDNRKIFLSDIKSIKEFKGEISTINGFSVIILSMSILLNNLFSNEIWAYSYEKTILLTSVSYTLVGSIIAAVGLIKRTTAKKYTFDSNYKMYIMSKDVFDKKKAELTSSILKPKKKVKAKKQD